MSNLKKVLALALAFAMVLTVMVGAVPNYYDDAEDVAAKGSQTLMDTAINQLHELNIMVGVNETYTGEDGEEATATNFNPADTMTRAEMARIAYAALNKGAIISETWADKAAATPFTDIAGSWAKGYIAYGYTMGYLSGKSDTTFDPNGVVTGYELASMLERLVIGYTADDIQVWPDDVDILGRTFGNNIFNLGKNTDGVLYEIDGVTEIARDNAAVMIYNAMCVAKTVTPASDLTVGYYVSSGKTYIQSVYKDYYVAKNAQIVAMGATMTSEAGTVKDAAGKDQVNFVAEEGYVVYKYTDAADKTVYYKQADASMTKAKILAAGTEDMLGSYVDATIYDSKVQFTSTPTNGYEVVAIETQFASATTANGYTVFTLKDGDATYTMSQSKATDAASKLLGINYYDFKTGFKADQDVAAIFNTSNADVVYAVVSGTAIKQIVGVKNLTAAKITKVDGAKITMGDVVYTNLNADEDLKLAVNDRVLYNRVWDDVSVAGTVKNVYVAAKMDVESLPINGQTSTGGLLSNGTAVTVATGAISAASGIKLGCNYTAYTFNGLVYDYENLNYTSTSNYLFTTAEPTYDYYQYNVPTTGYAYSVKVVFSDNVKANIVVSSVNGVATTYAGTGAGRFSVAKETLYSYAKQTDGTYALYSANNNAGNYFTGKLAAYAATKTFTVPATAAAKEVTYVVNNDSTPVFFKNSNDNNKWCAAPYSKLTFTANGNDDIAVASLSNGYWNAAQVMVLKTATAAESVTEATKYVYVTEAVKAAGVADYMNVSTIKGYAAVVGSLGSDETTFTFNKDFTIADDIAVGDIVLVTYANDKDAVIESIVAVKDITDAGIGDGTLKGIANTTKRITLAKTAVAGVYTKASGVAALYVATDKDVYVVIGDNAVVVTWINSVEPVVVPTYVPVTTEADLLAKIANGSKYIEIAANFSLSQNVTIPAGVTVKFSDNGKLTLGANTLTIKGAVTATAAQVAVGTGKVVVTDTGALNYAGTQYADIINLATGATMEIAANGAGAAMTLKGNANVVAGKTLKISANDTLTIAANSTLTIAGTATLDDVSWVTSTDASTRVVGTDATSKIIFAATAKLTHSGGTYTYASISTYYKGTSDWDQ